MKPYINWLCLRGWRGVAYGIPFLVALTGCSHQSLQVLRSPHDLTTLMKGNWMRSIRENPRLHRVFVRDWAGHQQTLLADSVWGYRTNRNEFYRLYQDDWYEVMQRGAVMIYRIEEWIGDSSWENYYFSLTPTGAIYDLDRRTVKAVFYRDKCMQRLLDQMRERQLFRTDSHGSYGLASAYSFCHCGKIRKQGS